VLKAAPNLSNRSSTPSDTSRRTAPSGLRPVLTGMASVLALVVVVLIVGPPEGPLVDVPDDGATVSPDRPLLIDVPPLRLALADATLYEIPNEPGANDGRVVATNLESTGGVAPWEASRFQLVGSDGGSPLRPDTSYRLVLTGQWSPLALPWLKFGPWRTEHSFTSHPSPRPLLPGLPLTPHYGRPFAITWNMPIDSLGYRISPSVESSHAIDPEDPRRVYITLSNYVPGETYRVEVIAATGANGVSLQEPYTFLVVTTALPTASVEGENILHVGEPIKLRWNEPIAAFDHHLDPPVASVATIDPADRRSASISLESTRQGRKYTLTISSAIAENGAPLERPQSFVLATPPPLEIVETTPGDGAFGVAPTQAIGLVFSEPVADRKVAERAVTTVPSVPGYFEWPDEREVRFVPDSPFPFEAEVTVEIAGGIQSVRGRSGNYMEGDGAFSFTVKPNKTIDVNLSRQVVTLYENGQAVLSSLTSTGARGDETPTGTYAVQYKIASTRMQGTTNSGVYYDVLDVPWVLVFWGNYTIHGAYWRRGFGFPQSAGCVSLPVPFAKQVYDWAPLGTPVVIHY